MNYIWLSTSTSDFLCLGLQEQLNVTSLEWPSLINLISYNCCPICVPQCFQWSSRVLSFLSLPLWCTRAHAWFCSWAWSSSHLSGMAPRCLSISALHRRKHWILSLLFASLALELPPQLALTSGTRDLHQRLTAPLLPHWALSQPVSVLLGRVSDSADTPVSAFAPYLLYTLLSLLNDVACSIPLTPNSSRRMLP